MVMNWLDPYQADLNLATYVEELGANEEIGTTADSIVSFFEENNVTVTAKENRTTEGLVSVLDKDPQFCSADEGLRENGNFVL